MMAQASLLSFFGKKADKENKPLPAASAKTATGKDETAAVATAAATEGEDIISKEASDAKTTADQTATVVTGKRTRKAIESGSDAEQDDTAVAVKKKKKRVSIAETPVQQESAPGSKPRTVASQGTSESQDDGNASPTTPRSKKQRRRKVRVLASSSDEDDDEDTSATSPHTNTLSSVGSNSKSSKEQSDTAMETGDDAEEGGETVSDAPEAAAEEVTSPKEAGKRVTATKSKPVKSARGRSRGNSMLMKKIASVGKKPAEQQQKIKSPPKTKATEKAAETPVAKEEESKADTAEASKTEEATAEETMNVVEDAPATQDVQPDALEAEATVTSADNAEADDEPAVTARSKRTRRKVRVLDSSSEDEGEEEEKKSKETSSPVSKKTSASRKKSTPSSSSRQPRRKAKDADSARPADSAGKDEAPNTTTSADTGEKEDTTPEETGGDAQDTEKRVSATKSKPTKTARGCSRGNSMLMKKIASVGKKPAAEQQPDKTNQTTATMTVAAAETEQTTAAASSADNAVTEESESADTTRTTDVAKEEKEEPMDTSSEPTPTPITCKVKAESKTAASGVKSEGTSSTAATGKAASVLSSSSSSAKGGHSSMPMPAINASSPKKRIPLSFFSPKSSSVQTATKASSTPGSATNDEKSCQPQVYNPAKANYHPVNDACWTLDSKNVPYLALARTLCLIEETSARLKITSILCNFFRSVIALAPDQLLACIYLCLNELGPAHEGLELGIGDSIVMKAISMATGRSMQALKSQMVELGDLGLVAEKSRSKQSMMYVPAALTVKKVFSQLKDIAQMTGSKSQQKKIEKINSLLVAGRDCEPRYIARSLTGKLRIGLAEQTLLMALAHAVVYTPPSSEIPVPKLDCSHGVSAEKFKARLDAATLIVKSTQSELPNYDDIVPALLEYGVDELPQHCKMTPGIPLKPMLAHPTKEIAEVLRRFDGCDFTCEYKYDGERAQIHLLEDGSIRIFSRNREDNTSKYPDIIARIPNMVKEGVKSFVIDTEAVAWDCEKKEIQPFQVLSTRKRKDADASEIKVQVCTFAFDLLYLNGKCFVKEPFRARRQALQDSFNTVDGEFMFVTQRDCTEPEQIEEFLDLSIQGNCEGLMVKTLDIEATYEIAKRSHNWLKVKKDYLEGMGDSLDLAVLGGYFGAGKRQGVYGAFLLACYNQDSEQYETVCKIGTGLKDDELQKHTKFFTEHVLGGPKSYYSHGSGAQQPDVWFDAVQVWEVKAADFTISPVYTAASGLVDASKGISMRFPRFIRIRDDKKAEDATSSEQMADMYRSQQNKKTSHAKPADDDEFY